MMTHQQIWDAIDALAQQNGLSPSGLAKRAGLDATAFNPSKRVSKDGRARWPSTESIAKVLEATGSAFEAFLEGGRPGKRSLAVPLVGLARAGAGGFFDASGFPVGADWESVSFPDMEEQNVYALEVTGESMLPLYRDGDVIIVSPTERPRRGDRVVVRTTDGEVMAKILYRQTADSIELHSINPEHPPRNLESAEVDWVARIIWASQ